MNIDFYMAYDYELNFTAIQWPTQKTNFYHWNKTKNNNNHHLVERIGTKLQIGQFKLATTNSNNPATN